MERNNYRSVTGMQDDVGRSEGIPGDRMIAGFTYRLNSGAALWPEAHRGTLKLRLSLRAGAPLFIWDHGHGVAFKEASSVITAFIRVFKEL